MNNSTIKKILAFDLLREDHRKIIGLIRQLEGIEMRAPEMKDGVLRELAMEISIHIRICQQILFPSLSKLPLDFDFLQVVQIMKESYRDWDEQLVRLNAHTVRELLLSFSELTETILNQEEKTIFAQVEKSRETVLDQEELCESLYSLRTELRNSQQYAASKPEVVQNPNGGEQMRRQG